MMAGRTRGITLLEYGIFAALFVAAAVALQIQLKRSIQGYMKRSTDSFSGGQQFSSTLSNYTKTQIGSVQRHGQDTQQGERRETLVSPEEYSTQPYADNFSDKRLTEEALFE